MLTRTAAHYPNSGHTAKTLQVVAEDWFHTFKGRLTDKAFIEAITSARRRSKFFPSESDIFQAAGIESGRNCKECKYYDGGRCPNLKRPDFNPSLCNSFIKDEWV